MFMARWLVTALTVLIAVSPALAESPERTARKVKSAVAGRDHAPELKSSAALVIDQTDGRPLFAKNVDNVVPIASITKLMTAMVVLDATLPMDERIAISEADKPFIGNFASKRLGKCLLCFALLFG